jgi:hypothetical protein
MSYSDLCQRLVDMDEEELVAIIEQPDGSMLDTPVGVARNGGVGRVRSNAEGSKSASAPDRAVKFKKQRQTPPNYVPEQTQARPQIQDLHPCSL